MTTQELNFDGIVGPTHHYAGLAFGNLASEANAKQISNPKAAALQGLEKMKVLMDLGVPQAVLPPHERPAIGILKNLGFSGSDSHILQAALLQSPFLFKGVYSASSMWTANAATVTPSVDNVDARVHITPANLCTHFHRAIEANFNYQLFKTLFSNEKHFKIHSPLLSQLAFADEGAANQLRFCETHGESGIHLFVYGKNDDEVKGVLPQRNPARQSLLASQTIARLHGIATDKTLFAKQNSQAIDQGVFHNDVISVANQNVFLYHEAAFEDPTALIATLQKKITTPFYRISVSSKELTLAESVQSYLFNSQIVTLSSNDMVIIAPLECKASKAHQVLLRILAEDNPIQAVHFVDCRQSMLNGGGPACLRLRMVLTEAELKACHPHIFLDQALYQKLYSWVSKHYRDSLAAQDLLDPQLLIETHSALEELTQILKLGTLYNFQKV